jgi:hypothetical protein
MLWLEMITGGASGRNAAGVGTGALSLICCFFASSYRYCHSAPVISEMNNFPRTTHWSITACIATGGCKQVDVLHTCSTCYWPSRIALSRKCPCGVGRGYYYWRYWGCTYWWLTLLMNEEFEVKFADKSLPVSRGWYWYVYDNITFWNWSMKSKNIQESAFLNL